MSNNKKSNDQRPLWKVLDSKVVVDAEFLKMRQDRLQLPDGRVMPSYFVVEFTPWVNVVAVTSDQKLVMVEQYRHGAQQYTLEIPGGAVDPKDQNDILAAGLRELREETGFAPAGEARVIATHRPNPALQNNFVYTVLANQCEQVGAPQFDEFEDVNLHIVNLVDVREMLKDGRINHSIVLGSLLAANPYLHLV